MGNTEVILNAISKFVRDNATVCYRESEDFYQALTDQINYIVNGEPFTRNEVKWGFINIVTKFETKNQCDLEMIDRKSVV